MKQFLKIVCTTAFLMLPLQTSHAQTNRLTLLSGQKIFASGINVAWNRFGTDVGSQALNTAWFQTMLDSVKNSGGNAVRWWLFTNAATNGGAPVFANGTGLVSGPGTMTITNIKSMLDMAQQRGIAVSLCLLSFDLLQSNANNPGLNKTMLTTTAGIQAFITNALNPVVTAIGKHPAILCWEIFNEPEGMTTEYGWTPTTQRIAMKDVQIFTNRAAGAIHRAVPGVPVSNGSWSFRANANGLTGGGKNYYSDSELVAAGGDSLGKLDFYQVHYYDPLGVERSPFDHPASYWKLDKPIVIGEFPAKGIGAPSNFTPLQAYNYLYDNGYAGALSWTYTRHDGFGGLPEAKPAMLAIRQQHASDIAINPTASLNSITLRRQRISGAHLEMLGWKNLFESNNLVYSLEGKRMFRASMQKAGSSLGIVVPNP